MQLREIHIDSFGVLRNRRVTGLSSGINVIHGPNEFGKTTILDFTRRILFGFPDRRFKGNLYHALDDSPHCGSLVCQLANGKTVTVSRREGPDGGPVEIVIGNQEIAGEKELYKIIGGLGGAFYQNVYAIDLDELGRKESLEEGEVENHIYGAGLGLEPGILAEIRKEFRKQAEDIFKSGGSAQEIPKLYRKIADMDKEIRQTKADLTEYDELVNKRDEIMEAVDSLAGQIRELEDNKRILENQRNLFQTYVDLSDAENKLARLEELPLFTDDAISDLETLKGKINTLNENIETETEELESLKFQGNQLVYDEDIVKNEPLIEYLWAESAKFESSSKDIQELKPKETELVQEIKAKIAKISLEWTEESISSFDLNLGQEDLIRTFKEDLRESDDDIKNIKAKQETYREKKVTEGPKAFTVQAPLKYWIYPVTVLALACVFWAYSASQLLLTVLSFIVFGTGVALAVYIHRGKTRDIVPLDKLEKHYNEELSIAEARSDELWSKWRKFLRGIGFDESLSPEGALEGVRHIKDIKSRIETCNELDIRVQEMQQHIDRVKEKHDEVVACLTESKIITEDISTNIKTFWKLLGEAKNTRGKKEDVIKQIDLRNDKIEGLKAKKHQAEEELQRYIASKGASDEDDFRHKYGIFMESKKLKSTIDESRKIIQSTVGMMSEHYDRFIQSISPTNPNQIESDLEGIKHQLEGLDEQRKEANQEIGKKINEINRLSSSEDLLVKQTSLEIAKQRLRDYSIVWAKSQIGLFVLKKAIREYESTMQPEVIKVAQDIFANITDNAYSAIVIPVGTKDFTILDSSGKTKIVREMSRGTKEQLYFAMRLGLIKVYEDEKEPMPIIMDDILVNFDDERGPLAIKELAEFARDRQVIILTCHENTLDIYESLGAKQIIFS